ncbi:MAG: hypothetical protein ACRDU0_20575, partial [Mycobacterium sp.]
MTSTVRVQITETDLGGGRVLRRGWANLWISDHGPHTGHQTTFSSVNGTLRWLDGAPYHNTQGQTDGIQTFPSHDEAQTWLDALAVAEVPIWQAPTRTPRPAPVLVACDECGTPTRQSLLMASS